MHKNRQPDNGNPYAKHNCAEGKTKPTKEKKLKGHHRKTTAVETVVQHHRTG
jgi:hypothetical protein